MKGKYRTALSTLGVAAAVGTILALFPSPPKASAPTAAAYQQVRIYRMAGGGLVRTETLRFGGPQGVTIVTWSSAGNQTARLPAWAAAQFQMMAQQQRLMALAMRQMITGAPGPWLTLSGPLLAMPSTGIRVQWPMTPRKPETRPLPRRPLAAQANPTVDL